MAVTLSKAVIEQIRAANDIVDVIGAVVPLKRSGSSFKGLCPFHREKTPSFHVNPQRQFYHCFGCQAGGDVFRFVMQYEGMDFLSAARYLADRAGLRLEFVAAEPTADKEKLYKLLEDVALFYHQCLASAPAARAYLAERELGEDAVREFLIGYAPPRRDALIEWARRRNYPPALLEAAGLRVAAPDEPHSSYDRFRDRLMFPVRDEIGRVVGFSGRLLAPDPNAAKYINTPETAVFHKGRLLYALDKARRALLDRREAILCEGQIDVIRCHLSGFTNAVAAQGTAFTEQHAALLKRYADSVIVVLDADAAGQQASLRTAEILVGAGLSVRIARLPAEEDPDSLIRRRGPEAFRAVLGQAVPVLDFQYALLQQTEDLSNEVGRLRAARAMLETIVRAPTATQRDVLLQQASQLLRISEAALRQDLARLRVAAPAAPEIPRAPAHPVDEVAVLETLVHYPSLSELFERYLPKKVFTDGRCAALYARLIEQPGESLTSLADVEDEEMVRLAAQIEAAPNRIGSEAAPDEAARDLILRLRRKELERRREELRRKRDAATGAQRAELDIECMHLTQDIKLLQQGWDHALPILELE